MSTRLKHENPVEVIMLFKHLAAPLHDYRTTQPRDPEGDEPERLTASMHVDRREPPALSEA
jgi:hypothetical protein